MAHRRFRAPARTSLLVGASLSLAATFGLAACGSSTGTNPPAAPGRPAGATNSPSSTTPPTTAPSSGGVSY